MGADKYEIIEKGHLLLRGQHRVLSKLEMATWQR